MVVGILGGTLKAGGAYVPLDPAYPNARLAARSGGCRRADGLTHGRLAKRLSEHGVTILQLDSDWENVNRLSDRDPKNTTTAENLAYVIYTSGSTGKPKGVQVSHLSVVNLFKAINPLFQFDDTDVWTAVHSYSFDISVWEIWGALFNGGRLIVVPAGWLSRLLRSHI